MRKFVVFVFALVLALQVGAQMTEQQKNILASQQDMEKMIKELEKTCTEEQAAYDKAVAAYEQAVADHKAADEKAQAEKGFFAKKKLQLAALNAKRKVGKMEKEMRNLKINQVKLLSSYCVASLLGKRELSDAELEKAKKELVFMKKGQAELAKKQNKSLAKKEKAEKRLADIPAELKTHEDKLQEEKAALAALQEEHKGTIKQQTLKVQIKYHETKINGLHKEEAKLQTEIAELKQAEIDKTALDVTIAFLEGKGAKADTTVVTEHPEEVKNGEENGETKTDTKVEEPEEDHKEATEETKTE